VGALVGALIFLLMGAIVNNWLYRGSTVDNAGSAAAVPPPSPVPPVVSQPDAADQGAHENAELPPTRPPPKERPSLR